jgi:tetratricopeptide (TPR) repeat protein
MGSIDRARDYLVRAIARNEDCGGCYALLGEISLGEHQYTRATSYLHRALEISGEEQAAMQYARSLLLSQQPGKAHDIYRKVLEKNPENEEAMFRLVYLAVQGRNATAARQVFKKYGRSRKTVWDHLGQGVLREAEGATDAALISYSVALRLQPGSVDAYAGCGRVYLAMGEFEKAIENSGRAMASDPYNPNLMLDLGKAYERKGDIAAATAMYAEVTRTFPDLPDAYFSLARIWSRSDDHEKATRVIVEGLAHSPRSARLHMALGHEYVGLGKYEEAVAAYQHVAKSDDPSAVEANMYIANIYSKYLGDEKAAQKYFKRYVKAGGSEDKMNRDFATSRDALYDQ